MNYLHPVSLTATIIKVFKRVVLSQLKILVTNFLDLWHFLHRREMGWKMLLCISSFYFHLDKPTCFICLMFFDFSSAFNTIQPHLFAEKKKKKYWRWRPASHLYSRFLTIWLIDLSLFNLALHFPMLYLPTLVPFKGICCDLFFSHYTLLTAGGFSQKSCPVVKFAHGTGLTG